ncbi:BZ3500_MvSof-1268-A1-R1_Chr9g10384 [Microbotryum saponariae]|uniref:BZ3500_MvSof-1268-A1-R1_Chr9g10384 protein n=1 Tax=Microbotryum saponariae TaxID=289078 RepID=A0A2X0KAS6_9BASI|nr:BZ3501_MvSof-1269-A2-R1_Chr9g10134 [Microbotryum saponariae]SCZ99998.1 BZ3500_MvSof-1268-A1-R1_Chr9g10384 [Microbotryum saponariae]
MEPENVYDYVGEVNASLECAICRNPFIHPVMSPMCQHIFCHHCISRALSLSSTCPIDRSALLQQQLIDAPRIVHQFVDELSVKCPHADKGCDIECERGWLSIHLKDQCRYEREIVTVADPKGKGKAKVTASNVEEDSANVDENGQEIWVVCDLCRVDLLASHLSVSALRLPQIWNARRSNSSVGVLEFRPQSHGLTCPSAEVNCNYCSTMLLRSALPSHHLENCPMIPIPCPHAAHGCSTRVARSLMADEHLDVACPYEPIKTYLDQQKGIIDRVEGENWWLRQRVGKLEEGMREMREVLEGVRRGMGEFWVAPEPSSVPEPTEVDATSSTERFDSTPLLEALPLSVSVGSRLSSPGLATPSTTLSTQLSSLQSQLGSLQSSHSSLEAGLSQTIHHDSIRTGEEIASLRAVTHGLRMQMHHVMMDVNRLISRRMGGAAMGAVGGGVGIGNASSGDSEGSDEELGGNGVLGMGGSTTMWMRPGYPGTMRRLSELGTPGNVPVGMRLGGASSGGMKL